jgi:hypothetical protein
VNQSDVLRDPLFQDLVRRHELAVRRLREDVSRLRSHHLDHAKSPAEETLGERWRSASLQIAAKDSFDKVHDTAADLLQYGFGLTPHSADSSYLSEIAALREQHHQRIAGPSQNLRPLYHRGPEEKVKVDDGPPITIVLRPQTP